MMNLLRRSISGWAGRIFFGLLLLVFAGAWTLADGFSAASAPNTVLTVGGTRVSVQEYQVAYQQALARVGQQLQRRPTPEEATAFGIDQQVLSQLGAGAVLDEQGRRMGLGLSEAGLLRMVGSDPAFQDATGNFSRASFRALLQNAGLTETAYLESLAQTSLRTQIVEAVATGAVAPQAAATAYGLYAGERRTVDYLTVPAPAVDTIVAPADDVLATYFTENSARYRAPETRSVEFAVISASALADPATVTQDEIAQAVAANTERFTIPERRRVTQIVFTDADAANAAVTALEGGATFDSVAQEAGRTPVDLGLVGRGDIPDAALAEAVFAASENIPTAIVEGAFGPAILLVTAIEPSGERPADEIRQELALDGASERANAAYESFDASRGRGATLQDAAAEAGLQPRTVEAIDENGNDASGNPVADLPAGTEFLEAVFDTDPGLEPIPLTLDNGDVLFFDVREITPSREQTLDDVRDRVLADWKDRETQRLVEERAVALQTRIEGGETLAAVAAAEGLKTGTASSITRASGGSEIGPQATQAVFAGPSGMVATAPAMRANDRLVLQVSQVAPPADPLSNVPPQQLQRLSTTLGNDLLQSYVTLLQGQYPVNYNSTAIQNVQAGIR